MENTTIRQLFELRFSFSEPPSARPVLICASCEAPLNGVFMDHAAGCGQVTRDTRGARREQLKRELSSVFNQAFLAEDGRLEAIEDVLARYGVTLP